MNLPKMLESPMSRISNQILIKIKSSQKDYFLDIDNLRFDVKKVDILKHVQCVARLSI